MNYKANRWTDEETAFLDQYHGLMPLEKLTQHINRRFRRGLPERTTQSVENKMRRMGISPLKRDGYVSLKMASEMLDVSYVSLKQYFSKGKRKSREIKSYCTGMGGRVLVSVDDLDKIKALYPPIPKGYIRVSEADKMLGLCGKTFTRACKFSGIPHVKDLHCYYVSKALAILARDYMRKTGRLKINWAQVVAEYNRLYGHQAA